MTVVRIWKLISIMSEVRLSLKNSLIPDTTATGKDVKILSKVDSGYPVTHYN